jgi:AraC-like DNA-binding protein
VLIWDHGVVISARRILSRDGVTIADVRCRHGAGRGHGAEACSEHSIVFVRRGCFVRSADGVETLLDATSAYCMTPGEEQRYDHPHAGGDDCTALTLEAGLVASLWGGETALPAGPIAVSPALDLEHRLLLAASRRAEDADELVERAIVLTATALEDADVSRVSAGRPGTARGRRALVDGVREALADDPDRSLADLSRLLAVSPHHLSRVFRAAAGRTISRQRIALRARAAMERLADGERDLARVAADLGFADQGHMCRVLRRETGATPSELRAALR